MKVILLSLFVALLMVGCGRSSTPSTPSDPVNPAKAIDLNDKVTRDKILAEAINDKKLQRRGKEGEALYYVRSWYENGKKKEERNWKDDKLMSAVAWKPNGEKCPVTNIDENGNGVLVWYKEDGTEELRQTFKDGERVDKRVYD